MCPGRHPQSGYHNKTHNLRFQQLVDSPPPSPRRIATTCSGFVTTGSGQRRRTRWLSICSGGSYFVGGYCPLDGPRGQSPRTRGGHNPKVKEVIRARSIPAHAGRTRTNFRAALLSWVNPRARGADVGQTGGSCSDGGQSPRTRGGRNIRATLLLVSRSIPARGADP